MPRDAKNVVSAIMLNIEMSCGLAKLQPIELRKLLIGEVTHLFCMIAVHESTFDVVDCSELERNLNNVLMTQLSSESYQCTSDYY